MKSMYIHIPFCKKICSYCDFCKMIYNKKFVMPYLTSLKKEIDNNYNKETLDTIYIGGGSPSSLSTLELSFLFETLKRIKLSKNYEFSFEININDITEELIDFLKKNRVNRISIGIETVNEKFYSFLNRSQTKDEVIAKIKIASKYFSNINVDFMYGFPGETIEDLQYDLEFFLSLNVPHISIYSLIIEENTKIFIDGVKPLDENLESSMYYHIISILENNGYCQYEISNFCKKGYESKHNSCYWDNKEYYGFGLGASGYVNEIRYSNTRSLSSYIKGNFRLENEYITKETDMENYMILGLRKTKGVSKKRFFEKYGFKIEQIFDIMNLIEKKLIIDDGTNIFIPKNKLYVSNSILVNFIGGCNSGKSN